MKTVSAVMTALVLAFVLSSNAHADYTYISLDYPGAAQTVVQGINDLSTIVGGYATGSNQYGFSSSGGAFTSLGGYPGAVGTEANDISNAGLIVGGYTNPGGGTGGSGPDRGFSLNNGTFTSLSYPGTQENWVSGVNSAGTIVGWYIDATNNDHSYTVSNGTYTPIADYPGYGIDATGINNAGTIVGHYDSTGDVHYGLVLSGGVYTSLGAPGASTVPNGTRIGTWASSINDAGTIVGYSTNASGVSQGYVLSGGNYTTLTYPGASSTKAYGINDAGTIVGSYTDASGNQHGFLATPNTTTYSSPVVNNPGSTIIVSGQYITLTGTVQNNSPILAIGSGGLTINGGETIFTNDVTNNAGGMVIDSLGNANGGFSINQATVIFNTFTNAPGATFTTNQSAVTFNGLMTNHGAWIIDPSTVIFRGNVTNDGTVTTSGEDTFEFLGSGTQVLSLADTNLTIGSLVIGPGVTLDITGTGILTVDGSIFAPGYYAEENGMIVPGTVPIPAALWLLGPGLAAIACIRKRIVN